jgi:hypothetical protein
MRHCSTSKLLVLMPSGDMVLDGVLVVCLLQVLLQALVDLLPRASPSRRVEASFEGMLDSTGHGMPC